MPSWGAGGSRCAGCPTALQTQPSRRKLKIAPLPPQPLREQEYPSFFSPVEAVSIPLASLHSAILRCVDGPADEASDPKKWKG